MLPAGFRRSLEAPLLFMDLLALPRPLTFAIFALVPVDTRLRCSEVNRAWRAVLADTTLWACLSLSVSSGLARFSLPLLRAAVSKAGGQLRAPDVTGQRAGGTYHLHRILLDQYHRLLPEVVAANTVTLTKLCLDTDFFWPANVVRGLIEAAPALQLLETSAEVTRDSQVARAMLRNEPPFQALRLRSLCVIRDLDTVADVVAFCLDVRCHASLERLVLDFAVLDTVAAMGAVVDACIALRLHTLLLWECRVAPTTLPELTRLVAAGVVRDFGVHSDHIEIMFDEAHESTRLFVAAVRASALTRLRLEGLEDLPASVEEASTFINARRK